MIIFAAALLAAAAPAQPPIAAVSREPRPADWSNVYRASCPGSRLEIAGFGNSGGGRPAPRIALNGRPVGGMTEAVTRLLARPTAAYKLTAVCDLARRIVEVTVLSARREGAAPVYEASRFTVAADGTLRFVGSETADAGTIWFEP